MPIKVRACPCCGSKRIGGGAMSVMSQGVRCLKCGLKIERTVPERWIKGVRTITQMDRHLLKKAAEAWNKRAKA